MDRRLRHLPAAVAIVLAILALVWITRPSAQRPGAVPCQTNDARFIGSGEGFSLPAQAFTEHGPICLGRFWYSTKVANPAQFFKVWANWGDPQHQDRADCNRGFWADVRLDPDNSTAGKWCYSITNADASSRAPIAAPWYGRAGSYTVSMKVWDADKTALKPSIATTITAQ